MFVVLSVIDIMFGHVGLRTNLCEIILKFLNSIVQPFFFFLRMLLELFSKRNRIKILLGTDRHTDTKIIQ